eukprot:GHVU01081876.1.p1 GENE.GHVU01081876.1~~GHVU01081876.1.p1  ORF type:complete len:159 (+),score=11.02 GHVU01081876.1:237-713(+)
MKQMESIPSFGAVVNNSDQASGENRELTYFEKLDDAITRRYKGGKTHATATVTEIKNKIPFPQMKPNGVRAVGSPALDFLLPSFLPSSAAAPNSGADISAHGVIYYICSFIVYIFFYLSFGFLPVSIFCVSLPPVLIVVLPTCRNGLLFNVLSFFVFP